MNGCELAIAISTLASALAAQIEDDTDLSVLASAMTQFGDTLATIAAWRAKCAAEAAKEKTEEKTANKSEQDSEQADKPDSTEKA
ncbi:MAG: hypothetical protein FWD84_04395 [Oscillospiraceae bacterium]|nr:hypothetical protein [Oscillospiraceae bacterium]